MRLDSVILIFGSALLFISQIQSKIQYENDVTSLLSDIRENINGIPGDNQGVLDALDNVEDEVTFKPEMKKNITELLGFIKPAAKKLMSGNGYLIASGCLDILSGIAKAYGGPLGVPIGAVADLVSNILSMVNGKGTRSPSESMIDMALSKYREKSLRMKANGAKREFTESIAFIETLKKSKNITVTKLGILASNVPIYRFSAFLGSLEYFISQGSVTRDLKQANKTIDFILLYAQLVVMRESILTDLCLLYNRGKMYDIGKALSNAIKVNRRFAREHLEFFNKVGPEHVVIASLYYPPGNSHASKYIQTFKQFFGVPDQPPVLPGYYTITNVFWDKWAICSRWWTARIIFQGCRDAKKSNIKIIRLKNGYSLLRSRSKKTLYVSRTDAGWVWGTSDKDPGEKGYMNFIRLRTGNYVLSTKKWPHHFLYMESSVSGYIRTWQGNPGPQGYWNLSP